LDPVSGAAELLRAVLALAKTGLGQAWLAAAMRRFGSAMRTSSESLPEQCVIRGGGEFWSVSWTIMSGMLLAGSVPSYNLLKLNQRFEMANWG
jgi:hypothetical protein